MDSLKRQLTILNLAEELSPELQSYFNSREIRVVNPGEERADDDWTHILTRNVESFDVINSTYDATEKDRFIISLSNVEDIQNFMINNGNFILSEEWLKGLMGEFILDKYLQGYGGINLSENYPTFKESGSFNITNPFNTGEYLDRLVHQAFEDNIEALAVKTYFDHLVMFLSGLKRKGKAGLPFEVSYGSHEDVFALQIHFFAENLDILDFSTSLGSTFSKKAEDYLLNIAVQSADFFDFSYMPELKKVMITGLWTKEERINYENRGFMFTAISGGMPALIKYENEGESSSLLIESKPLQDLSEKINIPGEDEFLASETVSAQNELYPDESLIIKGDKLLQELVTTVKGKVEEEKDIIRISGDKLDVEKFVYKVASSIDTTAKEQNIRVRTLGPQLTETIRTGLFDFAKGLNKSTETLTDSDLDFFQLQKMPEIIQEELKRFPADAPSTQKKELALKSLFNPQPKEDSKTNDKENDSKLHATLRENEKLKSQLKTLAAEVRIVKESRSKMAELQMKAAQAATEVAIPSNSDSDEALRTEFQQKLKDQQVLNEQDMKKLSALLERETKLIADLKQEETRARKLELEGMKKDAFFSQELEKAERQTKAKDLILIKSKETFTHLLEKKEQEIASLKQKLDQLTKAISSGGATNMNQTIKNLERQNQNLSRQIEVYKVKISSLASNMQPSKSEDNLKEDLRKLQMQNQQIKNQLDQAKREVDKLQTRLSSEGSLIATLRQEKAKLEQQLKKASLEMKDSAVVPSSVPQNDQELKRLQAQNQLLETQLKESAQKAAALEQKLLEAMKTQKSGMSSDDGSKVKVTQLENSVKKLTQDLIEAKNQVADAKKETNKLRQEKTALQNLADKMKKEADKAKAAAQKKTNGKAA